MPPIMAHVPEEHGYVGMVGIFAHALAEIHVLFVRDEFQVMMREM